MILTTDQLRAAAKGALIVRETAKGEVEFCRFTDAQKAYYEGVREDFYRKSFATSGVRLEFVTDSDHLTLAYHTTHASSRRYYYFDLTVDGVLTEHFGHEQIEESRATVKLSLPEGEHRVCLYLPCLASAKLHSLELADGASFTPVERRLKLLCYGDSITQGYDAKYPSQTYVNLLADKLNAEVVDQGIGGEHFCPLLLADELGYEPDIITVAYGTNDWSGQPLDLTVQKANDFYAILARRYPNAKIFCIPPIWRADNTRVTKVGTFEEGRALVVAAAKKSGAIVLDGDRMVPHVREAFADGYLHPNDFGFKCYAEELYRQMLPYLN